jgi:hypothetical protein
LLSLLHKEPAHGYELKLAIESMFGELWAAAIATSAAAGAVPALLAQRIPASVALAAE